MNDTRKNRSFDHGGTARSDQTDFSANISPLGVPGPVKAVLSELAADDAFARYPDPDATALCAAVAEREGVAAKHVLCGNGAVDLLYRYFLAVRPDRTLVLEPAFSEYEKALALTDGETIPVALKAEEGFAWTEHLLSHLTPDLDLFVLCSPGNPTGVSAPPDLLERVLDKCEELDIAVLWDASFLDLSETPDRYRTIMQNAWNRGQALTVLNSFTKLYALAGLRLGYLLTPDIGLLAKVNVTGAPWSVSSAAQAAGLAALRCDDYGSELRTLIATEKAWIYEAMRELGFQPLPTDAERGYVVSDANFLLFRTEREDLADLLEDRYDIVLRRAETFRGLDAHWCRMAVRTHDENTKLMNALKEVLGHG